MTSRERVRAAISHRAPDRVPVDLGSAPMTGIAAGTYAKVRAELGLPAQPVKVGEPFQVLAVVEPEVRQLLGVDLVPVLGLGTMFGFANEGWKPWKLFDGTDVLVPEGFRTTTDDRGDLYIYPCGDTGVPPSGHMPKGGYYFDAIVRQQPIDENDLRPEEWIDGQCAIFSEKELSFLQQQADDLYASTDLSLNYWFGQGGLGDIALVPGPQVRHPKGIRDQEEWYVAHMLYPDYIKGIYQLQTDIAMENLKLAHQALGDKIDILGLSGTDFGMQTGPFISPASYREFFKPHHQRMISWIHEHTGWKVAFHTCGSIIGFMDDFIEAGVDIVNPVQCSAAGMDPATLKATWGDRLTFWGAAVDTQRTLPFGTPEEVRAEVAERVRVFNRDGGYIAAAIHNIQQNVPPENVLALFETLRDSESVAV